jgi:hypothetical protein
MSNFNADMSPQFLDRMYDDFAREQLRLLSDFKTDASSSEMSKDLAIQKQLSLLNTIMVSILRFRNLRKKQAQCI